MSHLLPSARLLLPLALVVALAACDAVAGPGLADATATTSEAQSPPEWLTFYPGDSGSQVFNLNEFEVDFNGTTYHVDGRIRASLRLAADDQGGFDVRGHLNPQRLTVATEDGSSVYRITGAANFRGNVAAQGTTETDVSFNVITPGPEPNYRLVLTLSALVNDEGDGIIAAVTDVQIEER